MCKPPSQLAQLAGRSSSDVPQWNLRGGFALLVGLVTLCVYQIFSCSLASAERTNSNNFQSDWSNIEIRISEPDGTDSTIDKSTLRKFNDCLSQPNKHCWTQFLARKGPHKLYRALAYWNRAALKAIDKNYVSAIKDAHRGYAIQPDQQGRQLLAHYERLAEHQNVVAKQAADAAIRKAWNEAKLKRQAEKQKKAEQLARRADQLIILSQRCQIEDDGTACHRIIEAFSSKRLQRAAAFVKLSQLAERSDNHTKSKLYAERAVRAAPTTQARQRLAELTAREIKTREQDKQFSTSAGQTAPRDSTFATEHMLRQTDPPTAALPKTTTQRNSTDILIVPNVPAAPVQQVLPAQLAAQPAANIKFKAWPHIIHRGEAVELQWTATEVEGCVLGTNINGFIQNEAVPLNGRIKRRPNEKQSYKLTCETLNGATIDREALVSVIKIAARPTLNTAAQRTSSPSPLTRRGSQSALQESASNPVPNGGVETTSATGQAQGSWFGSLAFKICSLLLLAIIVTALVYYPDIFNRSRLYDFAAAELQHDDNIAPLDTLHISDADPAQPEQIIDDPPVDHIELNSQISEKSYADSDWLSNFSNEPAPRSITEIMNAASQIRFTFPQSKPIEHRAFADTQFVRMMFANCQSGSGGISTTNQIHQAGLNTQPGDNAFRLTLLLSMVSRYGNLSNRRASPGARVTTNYLSN